MISSRTSQQDNIVALSWHNDIVVLQYRDSESDQLHKCTKCWAVKHDVEQTGHDEPSREQPPCKRRKGETDVVRLEFNGTFYEFGQKRE